MAVYNGTLQVLQMDGTQIANLTDVTMTMSNEVFEVTTKESGGFREILPGIRDLVYQADGVANFQATNKDLADVFAAFSGRTVVSIVWTNAVTGDKKITQNAYVTNCEVSAPMEDTVTYSIEFSGTGAPTIATI